MIENRRMQYLYADGDTHVLWIMKHLIKQSYKKIIYNTIKLLKSKHGSSNSNIW